MAVLTFENSCLTVGGSFMKYSDPLNPLDLPPFTMRFQFSDSSYNPTTSGVSWKTGTTWQRVTINPNVWDYTNTNPNWQSAFSNVFNDANNAVSVLGANVKDVTNMISLFDHNGFSCNIVSMALFDISSISSMDSMFAGLLNLQEIPLFSTSHITSMRYVLQGCQSLTEIPLFDMSEVTDLQYAFDLCVGIRTVPAFTTSKVINMTSTFSRCHNLTTVPLLDTSSVLYMGHDVDLHAYGGMFYDSGITEIPAFDTSKVVSLKNFCRHCTHLKKIPLLDTSSVVRFDGAFNECYRSTGGALALYNQASSQTNPPTYVSDAFNQCGARTETGLAELQQIPRSWGGRA